MTAAAAPIAWGDISRVFDASSYNEDGVREQRPMVEYQEDPIGWITTVLEIPERTLRWSMNNGYRGHQWDGTPDPLVAIAEALADWNDVGIEAATATQKSHTVACLILWFLACWEGARAFTFAPKEDQLRLFIWTEIGKLWPKFQVRFPDAALTDLCLRMRGGTDDSWGARGYAVGVRADQQTAVNAQGMHAEHMLLVYEEMPGILQPVIEAGANTVTAPHNLRIGLGNPDNQLDTLHQFCTSYGVQHIRISAFDHPNVVTGDYSIVPGAVSQKSIDKRRVDYGEGSPLYESRVRGISPAQATNALIRADWLDKAAAKYLELAKAGKLFVGQRAKGVDVANSENGDKAAIADGQGLALVSVRAIPCPDSNALGRTVKLEMDRDNVSAEHVGVDPIGVGAGTVNELARLGRIVRRLNAASKPVSRAEKAPDGQLFDWVPDANTFSNLRAQMYWQFREDLRQERIAIDPRIIAPSSPIRKQLLLPTYEVENGKVVMQPKDELKVLLGHSPDESDAIVFWNWVRPRKADTIPAEKIDKDRSKRFDLEKKEFVEPRHLLDEIQKGTRERRFPAVRIPRRRSA